MSAITLYTYDASPPCRSVYIVAKEIGVELNLDIVNVHNKEQFNPDYLKMNPKHTVPTLVDGNLVLTDSHAITPYLVGKYAKNDDLYPKDVELKALVDQMLHFDNSVMFAVLAEIVKAVVYEPETGITEARIAKANEVYGFLNKYLELKEWAAIDRPTIADIHLATTVTTLDLLVPYAGNVNIEDWIERCKKLSCFSENTKGHQDVSGLFTSILKK